MNVLTLGLDASVLNENAPARERLLEYGSQVDRFDLVIPGKGPAIVPVSPTITIYCAGGSNKLSRLLRLAVVACRRMRARTYDVVSTRDPYFVGILALLLARRYHAGLELQIHGFEKYTGVRRYIAGWVLHRANGIRVVSKRLADLLVAEFEVSPDIITINPIRTRCESFMQRGAKQRREPRPEETFTFVTIGRLVPIKNIALQIRALAQVIIRYPQARLLVVGDGPEKSSLEQLANKLGVGSFVTFEGAVTDVSLPFTRANCYVLTSDYEGYGLAPIEAACFGLPVIMTDVGCAGEVLVNGVNGRVIPVGDEQAPAAAMDEMIGNDALRRRFERENATLCKKLPTREESIRLYRKSWDAVAARIQQ